MNEKKKKMSRDPVAFSFARPSPPERHSKPAGGGGGGGGIIITVIMRVGRVATGIHAARCVRERRGGGGDGGGGGGVRAYNCGQHGAGLVF